MAVHATPALVLIILLKVVPKLMDTKKKQLFRFGNFAAIQEEHEYHLGDPEVKARPLSPEWPLCDTYIFQYTWDLQQLAHNW